LYNTIIYILYFAVITVSERKRTLIFLSTVLGSDRRSGSDRQSIRSIPNHNPKPNPSRSKPILFFF